MAEYARLITDDLSMRLEQAAAEYRTFPQVHPADYIFWFVHDNNTDKDEAVRAYFKEGEVVAEWVRHLIAERRSLDEPLSLLEFASGYGRVTRHLARALPNARITASDIHVEALGFLRSFGVDAIPSSADPGAFVCAQTFDVVFALSFFTHMPKSTWSAWLRCLLGRLRPGGLLIFTTHGEPGMKVMSEGLGRALTWDTDGFWFSPTSEQRDLDTTTYGSTGTSFRFVYNEICLAKARLVHFREAGAGYQDLFIVTADEACPDRQPDPGVGAPPLAPVPSAGRATATPRPLLKTALVRHVESAEDCFFYHTAHIPSHGLVIGQWDLRGTEASYLGGIALAGRSVLEIGPASGHLTFWMERQGARVTAFDLDENQAWDLVPFDGVDIEHVSALRREDLRRLNNSWWFCRERLSSEAACVYGNVYDLDLSIGLFDVVTINSVLLHLRDPVLAIQRAAACTRDCIVVADVSERQFAGIRPEDQSDMSLRLIPRASRPKDADAWWYIPSSLVVEILRIIGFTRTEVTFHQARFFDGQVWEFYTVVGRR